MIGEKENVVDIKNLFTLPQGEKSVVGKVVDINNARFLDIRRYYRDDTTGKLTPSSRGVRLSYLNVYKLYSMGVITPEFFLSVRKELRMMSRTRSS